MMETASGVAMIALEFVAVWLLVDFVSGVVHWAEDSYGSESTPVIGRWVVGPNLLHHRDGAAFVRKSWIASSWDLAAAAAAILAAAGLAGVLTWHVGLFALLGANANQIHKWNHMRRSSVPLAVRVLRRLHLLQSPRHHAQHHRGAKNSHYCVITEALNPLLDRLGRWRALEKLLAPVLGLPRSQRDARPPRSPQPQVELDHATPSSSMRNQGSTSALVAMIACDVILLLMLSACSP